MKKALLLQFCMPLDIPLCIGTWHETVLCMFIPVCAQSPSRVLAAHYKKQLQLECPEASPHVPHHFYVLLTVPTATHTIVLLLTNTVVVSRIYAPHFATSVLVESMGGGDLYAGSDILSCEYAPSSSPTPRCWHGSIILQTNRSWFNTDLPSLLSFSGNSNTFWSRLTDKGWPQHTQRHFPSTPQVCPFNVL